MKNLFFTLISIGLGSIGIMQVLKAYNSIRFDFFRKIYGFQNLFFFLILSNIIFYVYFLLQSFLYNFQIVQSKFSEQIDGKLGGYIVPEIIGERYFYFSDIISYSFIGINSLFLIGSFYFRKKSNLNINSQERLNSIYTFILIILSIITTFISVLLLLFMSELFAVSYEINLS
jgi:hypothetical protein